MTHEFNKKAGVSYNFKRKSPKLNDVEDVDDLLIGDFHDSFHNLTYKDSMLVNWVKHDCPSAEVGFHFNFANRDSQGLVCSSEMGLNSYIDVGDRCWRPNVLVTSLRCW